MPGQACALDGSDVLLPALEAKTILADRGYDAEDRVLKPLRAAEKEIVIPPRKNHKEQLPYDVDLYKARHLVENTFLHLKRWRGIATRYAKNTASFPAAVHSRCLALWPNIS